MAAELDTLQVKETPGRPDPYLRPRPAWPSWLDGEEFVGLITRVDLINYLRLHPEGSNSRMAAAEP
jgi:hypothetical protein